MSQERLPPLRLLSVFDAVLREGGIGRAAQALNVTQPAVSQAIRQLEDHLGLTLFDRSTRPAPLTEAGQILHQAVASGFEGMRAAIARAQELQAAAEGSLTIACTVGTATYWLMPSLTGFHGAHGEIAVSVRTTAQGMPRLGPGVDLAIRYGRGDWGDGRVERLMVESVVPVCSPGLARAIAAAGGGLERVPLLHVDAGMSDWMGWGAYFARIGRPQPGRAQPGRQFTNYVQATQAALGGLGVMLGWRSNVGALVMSGELVALPMPVVLPEEGLWLVLPPGAGPRPALAALVAWLQAAGAETEAAQWPVAGAPAP